MVLTVNLSKSRYTLIRLPSMSATCMCCALSFVSLSKSPFRRVILHPKASVHFQFHQNPRYFILLLHIFQTDLILNGSLKTKNPSALTHNKHSAYSCSGCAIKNILRQAQRSHVRVSRQRCVKDGHFGDLGQP